MLQVRHGGIPGIQPAEVEAGAEVAACAAKQKTRASRDSSICSISWAKARAKSG